MHVDESGPSDAPALLLLHGGGVSGWMWRPMIAAPLMRDSARILHEARVGSELRVVDGVGHGLPLQRPDLLAEIIDERMSRAHPRG